MMVVYHSPFHLIPEAKRDHPETLDLKILRRELLLRLELSGETTIQINGREYDRNDIIQAIESLKTNYYFHLSLYRNQPLLRFIESGQLTFFDDPDSWPLIEDNKFQQWIAPYFCARYADVLYRLVAKGKLHHINKLSRILKSDFPLPLPYRELCYQPTVAYYQELIKEISNKFRNPFPPKSKKLPPELANFLCSFHYKVLSLLPEDFFPVKKSFGDYCYRLLALAIDQDNLPLDIFPSQTRHILKWAVKIALLSRKNDLLREIERKFSRSTSALAEFMEVFRVLHLISVLIIFFVIFLNTCTNEKEEQPPPIEFNLQALFGEWDRSLYRQDTTVLEHKVSFFKNGTGLSVATFRATSDFSCCQLETSFVWTLTKEEEIMIKLVHNPESFRNPCEGVPMVVNRMNNNVKIFKSTILKAYRSAGEANPFSSEFNSLPPVWALCNTNREWCFKKVKSTSKNSEGS